MAYQYNSTFLALTNAAVDGILAIDADGIIKYGNPAIERIFGYQLNELLGNNVSILMPRDDGDKHDHYLNNHLETGEENIIGIGRELKGQKKNGEEFPLYLSVGRIEVGDSVTFVGILRDLTEDKEKDERLSAADQEIHQLINRLAHISRVSALGEMAAGIAHEINQPLTAISSYAQTAQRLLDNGTADDELIHDILGKISRQSLRAGEIIRSMRKWAKRHDVNRERFCINSLIEDLEDIARLDAQEHDVELCFDLEESLPEIVGDTVQIQQVILNLVRNAIEAMADLAPDHRQQGVSVKTQSLDDSRIKITVSDHGPGISPELKNKLFLPFTTTKENGTGLGLSICKNIISAHGGDLLLEPDENMNTQGAAFSVILPTSMEEQIQGV